MKERARSQEVLLTPLSGWPVLLGLLVFAALIVTTLIVRARPDGLQAFLAVGGMLTFVLTAAGFYVVQPNTGRAMVFFGRYRGTVREDGFGWINPFMSKKKISLKAHNVASETIKVNDLAGNPIEIGAVVVWQVIDTAQALFDVEDYRSYVDIQIETAVRQLASRHPYDEHQGHDDTVSLRGDSDQVSVELQQALAQRLERAGIGVIEARLSHLAYAPEIASAMLQRQQAQAIIAARQQIVEGAVGMVEQALGDLASRGVLKLDDERRAALVGNLLVVLCGQAAPQPVLNTGAL